MPLIGNRAEQKVGAPDEQSKLKERSVPEGEGY